MNRITLRVCCLHQYRIKSFCVLYGVTILFHCYFWDKNVWEPPFPYRLGINGKNQARGHVYDKNPVMLMIRIIILSLIPPKQHYTFYSHSTELPPTYSSLK